VNAAAMHFPPAVGVGFAYAHLLLRTLHLLCHRSSLSHNTINIMPNLSEAYKTLRTALQPGLANPADPVRLVREKMHAIHPTQYPDDVSVEHFEWNNVAVASVQTPEVDSSDSAVMMVHGGAFVSTGIAHYIPYAAELARVFRRSVFIFEYRLAPEHPFPAALDDSLTVYRKLKDGFGASKLAVIGDSCGGGIALSMLCQLRDTGGALPAAYAGLSPWFDLLMSGDAAQDPNATDPFVSAEWIRQRGLNYAGTEPPEQPAISPLYADMAGPPLFLGTGSEDITRDDSRRLAAKALAAGTQVELDIAPHMIHGYHGLSAMAPECADGCRRVADFLDRHLK
jgi:monoterpene epsilon-lactone hydrolase